MPRYEPFDWYDDVRYYDIVFDVDTPREADFIEAVVDEHGRTRGRQVLEPACGSGRLVRTLAERGWRVTGFDLSDGSLAFARARLKKLGLRATLTKDRMETYDAGRPRFDVAHCLVSTFRLLDREDHARAHLRSVAAALKPGGVYILGVHLSDYSATKRARERWLGSRGGVHVTCNIQAWPPDRTTRTERTRSRLIIRPTRGPEGRLETTWNFRTYDLAQLRRTLRAVPAFEHVATYDFNHDIEQPIAFDGSQSDVVLILRRREDPS